jgi:integrase
MAGARQREMAARQEAGGAEPRDLLRTVPAPSAKTAGTSHGRTSTHARNCTDEWSDRRSNGADGLGGRSVADVSARAQGIAGTGMRQGECFGLTLDKVDFLRRSVRVDQQLVLLPRTPPYLAPPKTAASHRTIPLPNVVITALSEHIRQFPVTHSDRLLFTDDDGEAIRRTTFSREIWRPTIAKALGVPDATGMHDLRH